MNILFSCDEYPPIKTGGIGVATKITAEALVKRGHKVYVVGGWPWGEKLPFESKMNGVVIYRLSYFKWLRYFDFLPKRYRNLVLSALRKSGLMSGLVSKELRKTEMLIDNIIQREKIDLLELPDYNVLSMYFHKSIKFERFLCPTIMRVHGSPSFLNFYKNDTHDVKKKIVDKANLGRADYVCAVSNFSSEYVIRELNVSKEKVSVIYNPIETCFFDVKDIPEKRNNIVFFGKVIETKGAFTLLKAFNRIASKYPEITLTLLGKGEIERAKDLVEKACNHRVLFCGYVNRDRLQNEIQSSMFCVIPSYFETFGMAALEVMACKKALIYTKRASGPELISHGVDGLLVDPENVDEIFDAMDLLISNESLRDKIAEQGFKRAYSQFREQVIVGELEKYYENVLNNSKSNEAEHKTISY